MMVTSLISEGGSLLDMNEESNEVRWQIHRRWPQIYNKDESRINSHTIMEQDQINYASKSGDNGMVQVAGELKNSPILLGFELIRLGAEESSPTSIVDKTMTPTGGRNTNPTGVKATTPIVRRYRTLGSDIQRRPEYRNWGQDCDVY